MSNAQERLWHVESVPCISVFCFFFCSLALPTSAAPAMCQQPRSALNCENKRNFCGMTPFQLENIHRHFEGPWCLYLQGTKQCLSLSFFFLAWIWRHKTYRWRKKLFRNVRNYSQKDTELYIRRLDFLLASLWLSANCPKNVTLQKARQHFYIHQGACSSPLFDINELASHISCLPVFRLATLGMLGIDGKLPGCGPLKKWS